MQKKIILKSLTTLFLLIFVLFTVIFALEDTAEQYAQSLGIEESAIKIISRLDRDNHFDELEKDFITWLASQDKESQFKLAFKYAFDGEISAPEMSEILSTPIIKKIESEKTSSPKSEIEYFMLDDFEDKKITEENKWRLGKEKMWQEGFYQNVYIDSKNSVEDSGSSLCIAYKMPTGPRITFGHGCLTGIDSEQFQKEYVNYDGITFFIKTTDTTKKLVTHIGEADNKDSQELYEFNFFIHSNDWTKIYIPFNRFKIPEENAIDSVLRLDKISHIHFEVCDTPENPGGGVGKVWIDEIALYKGEIRLSTNIKEKDDNFKQIAVYRGEDSQDLSFSIEDLPKSKKLALHEALYYQKLSGNTVQCELCPNRCTLAEGEVGDCNNRKNIDGKLYTLVYGQPCALTVDPIEKGPMFHMKPGMRTLALGTAGCNLKCKNCQNWQFTQVGPEETENYRLSPQEAINLASKNDCEAIVFTYNDPIVSYEYVLEMAKLAKKNNLKTIMITAGYINPEPLRELCQYMDAIKIDLKGFTNEFYQQVCRATLQPVLDAIKIIKAEGVWLEIVNLVIPSFNDNSSEIKAMCSWIVENVGPDIPIHFSRFWHSYKLENMETTPVRTLESAFSIATAAGLNYVYIGNVPGHSKGNTYCPHCGKLLIERIGFLAIGQNNIVNGKCKFCGEKIPGVW